MNYINRAEEIMTTLRKFSPRIIELGETLDVEIIAMFEEKYSLILPNDFKYLLSKLNGISLVGAGYYGLTNKPRYESLESVYVFEHFTAKNITDSKLVPIHNDGGGNFYCLDTSNLSPDKSSCPIVFWQSGYSYTSDDQPDVDEFNFLDWVENFVIKETLKLFDYEGNLKRK